MTLFGQFMTLIVFPLCLVIQLIAIDEVVSNHLISGDDVLSRYPVVRRGAPTRYLVKCGHSFIQLIPSLRYP